MKRYRLLLLSIPVLALAGCYLQNREELRPAPAQPDVMAEIQAVAAAPRVAESP